MKVVLDCNVVISFLISPGKNIRKIKEAWHNNIFELLISDEILMEIKEILRRLKKLGYFNSYESTNLLKLILKNSTLINVITIVDECIDKKDNRYLGCAKDGKANYLVTGDTHHLIPMQKYKYTRIVSPSDFYLILSALPNKLH